MLFLRSKRPSKNFSEIFFYFALDQRPFCRPASSKSLLPWKKGSATHMPHQRPPMHTRSLVQIEEDTIVVHMILLASRGNWKLAVFHQWAWNYAFWSSAYSKSLGINCKLLSWMLHSQKNFSEITGPRPNFKLPYSKYLSGALMFIKSMSVQRPSTPFYKETKFHCFQLQGSWSINPPNFTIQASQVHTSVFWRISASKRHP